MPPLQREVARRPSEPVGSPYVLPTLPVVTGHSIHFSIWPAGLYMPRWSILRRNGVDRGGSTEVLPPLSNRFPLPFGKGSGDGLWRLQILEIC